MVQHYLTGWACDVCVHRFQTGKLPDDFEFVEEYWEWANKKDVTLGGILQVVFDPPELFVPNASEPLCCDICTYGLQEEVGTDWRHYHLVPSKN